MHSRTKAVVTQAQLLEMISVAGLGAPLHYHELTGGEYNLAYKIETPKGHFVLKVGPSPYIHTMNYEKDLMSVELWGYALLRKHTDIILPEIIHTGNEVIGNSWFVMTELTTKLFCDAGLTGALRDKWLYQYGTKIAQMHKIHNSTYGYHQVRQHESWKEAYYDMVFSLIEDVEEQGLTLPGGARILRYIRKHEHVLDTVTQPCFVHFDLFTNNIFADEDGNFAGLIDIERCFWGDFYADFLAFNLTGQLSDIPAFIAGYNAVAEEKIVLTADTRARMSLMRIYIGLIVFGEGTTRLSKDDPQYWNRRRRGAEIIQYALHELDDIM